MDSAFADVMYHIKLLDTTVKEPNKDFKYADNFDELIVLPNILVQNKEE